MTQKVQNIDKPNTLIIGAPRCGTTKIYKVLGSHPNVYMSQVKEPAYFCPGGLCNDWKEYLNLFGKSNEEKVIGEASTGYLHGSSPRDIKNKLGKTKIIVSIRDPIERSKSHYRYKRRNRKLKICFDDFMKREMKKMDEGDNISDVLKCSFYYKHIKKFEEKFGEGNMKVIVFEELISDILEVFSEICQFLGIDNEKLQIREKAVNPGNKPFIGAINSLLSSKFTGKKILKNIIPDYKRRKIARKIKELNVTKYKYNVELERKTKKRMVRVLSNDVEKTGKINGIDISKWKNKYQESPIR